jgi:hypothetical protein
MFPSIVDGKPAIWIPDNDLRKLANELRQRRVLKVQLRGSRFTGVPEYRTIRNPEIISHLIDSLDSAVRLDYSNRQLVNTDPLGSGVVPSPYPPPDKLIFILEPLNPNNQPDEKVLVFYADIYEGTYTQMSGGTVSPAFQDVLRRLRIPLDSSKRDKSGAGIAVWIEDVAERCGLF